MDTLHEDALIFTVNRTRIEALLINIPSFRVNRKGIGSNLTCGAIYFQ